MAPPRQLMGGETGSVQGPSGHEAKTVAHPIRQGIGGIMEHSERRNTGLGTAALVCGIVALIVSFVPFVNLICIPLALVAIVLGAVDAIRGRGRRARPVMGIVTGGLSILVFASVFLIMFQRSVERRITVSEYGSIRSGMSYQQVSAIVGSPGRPVPVPGVGALYEGYAWPGVRPKSGAIIVFVDGKVFAKDQRNMR